MQMNSLLKNLPLDAKKPTANLHQNSTILKCVLFFMAIGMLDNWAMQTLGQAIKQIKIKPIYWQNSNFARLLGVRCDGDVLFIKCRLPIVVVRTIRQHGDNTQMVSL